MSVTGYLWTPIPAKPQELILGAGWVMPAGA